MELQMFHQNGFEIRGGLLKDKPYFVAMDIARALEYSETAMMLRRLDDDEIMELSADLAGGFSKHASNIKIINESGLYNAILGSKKPQAKTFKKWITSEVLPSI
ncbi:Bro-N domain-containing protein, partial [uncultured Helicobacter sp.]|uniref:BRO-N domain-containing protein n=1 Tax=uncultured Helicobacter sp. TaxID=175537 RepID=UPI002602A632